MATSEGFAGLRVSGGNGNLHRFSFRGTIRIVLLTLFLFSDAAFAETWRGLVVAPEHRYSSYERNDYCYSQSVEPRIEAALGTVYGPCTGRCFADRGRPTSSTSSPCRRRTTAVFAPPMPARADASPPIC